ncbi:nucleotidyltransferase family protein [Georgenia deserti]|uniref:NTP transferase domain-containing protein n=1 Tax=Georgenia deserti TaxID=2093781 RepID=A0ABW4L504_9MICO
MTAASRPGADVVGIVLAAGAGRRMGRPKALVRGDDGVPWLRRAVTVLKEAGAWPVRVTLGAGADEASALLPAGAQEVRVPDWAEGIGASLRAGLAAAGSTDAVAALITLVDLPALRVDAVRRVLGAAPEPGESSGPGASAWPAASVGPGGGLGPADRLGSAVLRQAVYAGRPGHPVLIGRDHWADLRAQLDGDVGARPYLRSHGVVEVDCTDLGGGDDVDTPA